VRKKSIKFAYASKPVVCYCAVAKQITCDNQNQHINLVVFHWIRKAVVQVAHMSGNQSGAEPKTQDGGAHEARGKVGHVEKQPTSLDKGPGSVSRISMATQSLEN